MNLLTIRYIFTVLAFSLILICQTINAQQPRQFSKQPKVLTVIAPTFIPWMFNETGVAEVIVEVKINSEGKVVATKTVAVTVFRDLSVECTAKRWIFEKDNTQKERTAKIKFVFRIMPKETKAEDLTAIYRDPLEIEVRSPIIDSPKTIFILPDQK